MSTRTALGLSKWGMETMKPSKPEWNIPQNLQSLLDSDEDLTWEAHDWSPIQLTVMGGTTYDGRDIDQSWQIEFDPSEVDFEASNQKLSGMGIEADGYGWARLIQEVAKKYHPDMADELHFGDTEESTCVVWVESEATCRRLVDVVWTLIYDT